MPLFVIKKNEQRHGIEGREVRTRRPFLVVDAIQFIASLKGMNRRGSGEDPEQKIEEYSRLHRKKVRPKYKSCGGRQEQPESFVLYFVSSFMFSTTKFMTNT